MDSATYNIICIYREVVIINATAPLTRWSGPPPTSQPYYIKAILNRFGFSRLISNKNSIYDSFSTRIPTSLP